MMTKGRVHNMSHQAAMMAAIAAGLSHSPLYGTSQRQAYVKPGASSATKKKRSVQKKARKASRKKK
tara:strand:+ start:57892 stop:58089 length:198 start_codon:yes stop_codon:yes gene_type:complete